MAKEYKEGEKYYLPVIVDEVLYEGKYPVKLTFLDGGGGDSVSITDEPNLLLTAEEIYANRQMADKIEHLNDMMEYGRKKYDEIEELKSRNAELEALLKEVMATRDEAIKQNNELIAENKNLKSDCNDWKDTADERIVAVQSLTAERDNLKAELDQRNKDFDAMKKDRDNLLADNKRTTAYYMEANRTATEAAEANDELKAKIADLRNRVGEQLAQIQDLNAEIHFHKEFGEGLDKQQKELQARYDELDSVNKEQAEKIRKLDKALTDLKKRNDDLQDENTNLNFLLEAQPEKGAARKVHVITNDGKEYMFRKCTKASFDNYNDFTVLKIYEGDTYVAGFLRGDSPDNFAAWWTE